MFDESLPAETRNPRVEAALRDYLERLDRGEPVDREDFLQQHPEIADALRPLIVVDEELRKPARADAPSKDAATRSTDHLDRLTPDQRVLVEEQVKAFKKVWQKGERPAIAQYLPDDPSVRTAALIELVQIDQQHRFDAGAPRQVASYLDEFPALADDLRQLSELIAADKDFRKRFAETATRAPEETQHSGPTPGDKDSSFGDYELLEEIARGGMGVVYRARRVSLNRVVALKMILSGQLASEREVQRFYTEAQAAANLQHPNIVAIHEVGQHAGQHYFSMDYVEGKSLAQVVREKPFAAAQAARYVKTIADAIEYAHRHGTLHRDLKPANVLIDAFDQPRVTDFGLAKRIEGTSELTSTGSLMGTPSYMPPEQAGAHDGKVGPTSDVYSLGAILYELVTGRPPFLGESLVVTLNQVLNTEPVSPRLLNPALPRDLETICLKCLEKQPGKRYQTAADLGADLGRFLKHEPILARPVGAFERTWRWGRRNPALAGSLAVVVLGVIGLTVGLILVTGLNCRLDTALHTAETERDTANEQKRRTRTALDTMVSSDMIERLGAQKELNKGQREFLQKALAYYREFAAEAATDEEGRKLEALANHRVGYLLRGLGQNEDSRSAFRTALSIYEKLAAQFPAITAYHESLADIHNNLGIVLVNLGKRVEAESAYRAAIALYETLAASFPAEPKYREKLGDGHNNLGLLLHNIGKRAEAETDYRSALAIKDKLAAEFPAVPRYRANLADGHNNLGVLLIDIGKRAEAETEYRAALAIKDKLAAEFPAVPGYRAILADGHNNLALLLNEIGKQAEAEQAHRAALLIKEKLAAEFPALPAYRHSLADGHNNLGGLLRDLGKRAEAETEFRAALAIYEKLAAEFPALPAYRHSLANSHNNLGDLLKDLEKPAEAEAAFRVALAIQAKLSADFPAVPAYRQEVARSQTNLAIVLSETLGKQAEAEQAYRAALVIKEKLAAEFPAVPAYRELLAGSHYYLGILLNDCGKQAEAETEHRAALAIKQKLVAEFPAVPGYLAALADSHNYLGTLFKDLGKPADAEAALRKALAIHEKLSADFPAVSAYRQALARTQTNLGKLFNVLGRRAEASAAFGAATEQLERLLKNFPDRTDYRLSLAAARIRSGDFRGVASAEDLVAMKNPDSKLIYDCACVLSLTAAAPNDANAESHARRAVALLRRAFIEGYMNVTHLLEDTDLDALRRRADYTDLLWDLADCPPNQRSKFDQQTCHPTRCG